MKKSIYVFVVIVSVVFLSGCDKLPWQQEKRPAYEELTEMTMAEKEAIMDAYIASRPEGSSPSADELKRALLGFEEDGIFDDMRAPDLLEGKSYEQKVTLSGDFIAQMMEDIDRTQIAEGSSTLTDDAVPIVDLATGAKKFFHAGDGQERYTEYLAQRFTIGVYPTAEEMEGEWIGRVNIGKVVVFKEMVGAPQHDPSIYNAVKGDHEFEFMLDMDDMPSEEDVQSEEEYVPQLEDPTPSVQFNDEPNGTLTPLTPSDAAQFPFTYTFIPDFTEKTVEIPIYYNEIKEEGGLTAQFGDEMKKVEGIINVSAINKDGKPTLSGEFHINFLKRFVKMSGSFSATKK